MSMVESPSVVSSSFLCSTSQPHQHDPSLQAICMSPYSCHTGTLWHAAAMPDMGTCLFVPAHVTLTACELHLAAARAIAPHLQLCPKDSSRRTSRLAHPGPSCLRACGQHTCSNTLAGTPRPKNKKQNSEITP